MIGRRLLEHCGTGVFLGTTLLALPVAAAMCGARLAGFGLVAATFGGMLALDTLRRVAAGPDGHRQARAVALAMLASLLLLALTATLVDLSPVENESSEDVSAY